jgi:polar amino acid transport system permease protein
MTWRFDVVTRYLPFLLSGLGMTVAVTILSMALGLGVGLVVALLRLSRVPFLRFIAGLYIDLARSTPTLAQLLWVFYALPILIGFSLEPFPAAVLTLGFHVGAYLAEIYRAGILSIAQGQRHAGLSLGMTPAQVLRRIILPQAVTRMLPPIGSQFISLFKESALVSLITLQELMWQAQSLAAFTMRPLEVLTATALIYLVLTVPQALGVNYLHRKYLAH